jgi:hypothetical protein
MQRARLGARNVERPSLRPPAALALACGSDPYEGMPEPVKRCHIELEGARTFGDLGGYATEHFHKVRWGLGLAQPTQAIAKAAAKAFA